MLDRIMISGQPWLYVTTRCSTRPSTMASEVKASLSEVREFLVRLGHAPCEPPIVVYSDWDGRLVTIESGYAVTVHAADKRAGRILSGKTPAGAMVTVVHHGTQTTLDLARAQLPDQVLSEGERVTGLTWESYLDGDGAGPAGVTALYVQLLAPCDESPIDAFATSLARPRPLDVLNDALKHQRGRQRPQLVVYLPVSLVISA